MRRTKRCCRWGAYALVGCGLAVLGVVWSVLVGVGPIAASHIDIGNEQRPMKVSLHQLVVAWRREHGLMRRDRELSDTSRTGLLGFTRVSITRKKVQARVDQRPSWVLLPASWEASLVMTITNAHLDKKYFVLEQVPQTTLVDMVAVED